MALVNKLMDAWRDTYTIGRVFGEPIGFGGVARPAGVYVVRAESVEWQPALGRSLRRRR